MIRACALFALLATPALGAEVLTGGTSTPADDADLPVPSSRDASPAIINGRAATLDEWPMAGGILARVRVRAFGTELTAVLFTCSSTLIAPDVVLTAAHCVDESLLEAQVRGLAEILEVTYAWTPEVDLSGYGLGGPSTFPEHARVAWDHTLHPSWVGAERIQLGVAPNHDIALMFLEQPVLDRPHAYLPLPSEAAQLVSDAPVVIVGWGNQLPVPPGQMPQAGRVGIKHVADSFIGAVGETEFQVGVGPQSSRKCQGDSGGPTFQEVATDRVDTWRVIGATSHTWDTALCENTGGVDTRADYYLDWIDAEMRSRCDDGSRAWCGVPGIVEPPSLTELGTDDEDEARRACGCAAAPHPSAIVTLGGLALLARRRRREA
jgi:MYXO-CTERM domain-containing protein